MPAFMLPDDDPEAMGTLFSVFHFQEPIVILPMDKRKLAILAIHSDKYDCTKSLGPWVYHWFDQYQRWAEDDDVETSPPKNAEEFGLVLLAAHLFRMEEYFSSYYLEAQRGLSYGFFVEWRESKNLSLMPETIEKALIKKNS